MTKQISLAKIISRCYPEPIPNNFLSYKMVLNLLINLLEPVQSLLSNNTKKESTTICKLVLIFLSQFFHKRQHFSNQPKDLSTTQRFGMTAIFYAIQYVWLLLPMPQSCPLLSLQNFRQSNHHLLKYFQQVQIVFCINDHCHGAISIGNFGCRHVNCIGQSLCVYSNMSFISCRHHNPSVLLYPYFLQFAHLQSKNLSSPRDLHFGVFLQPIFLKLVKQTRIFIFPFAPYVQVGLNTRPFWRIFW